MFSGIPYPWPVGVNDSCTHDGVGGAPLLELKKTLGSDYYIYIIFLIYIQVICTIKKNDSPQKKSIKKNDLI